MDDDSSPTAWNTYIAVESADDAAAKAFAAGGKVVMGPFDVGDAGRMAVLADREGAVFCVWEAGATAGAQLVNEPNSWSFNDLASRDPESAIGFYGELFGWEIEGAAPQATTGSGSGAGRATASSWTSSTRGRSRERRRWVPPRAFPTRSAG